MGTQGIVSVCEHDEVVMKVIAGTDGYNAPNVAKRLQQEWPVSAERAYDIAVEEVFGTAHDLVVLTLGQAVFQGEEDLDPRYQATFGDPNFNPRWELGIADHVEVIDI
ncbi:MAG: hypothetical protein WC777_03355 [Candidatus Gracilibacteria bacterium]|jgi:hypothetical protein